MAEVFAWADGRVLKLDRPEWNGVAVMEAAVLATVTDAGVPAPRPYETVVVDGRHGVVMDRIDGSILSDVVAGDLELLAATWTEMHRAVNARVVSGLPNLVASMADGIAACGLEPGLRQELIELLASIDDGERVLCHFDLHPGNVIVGPRGWVIIDWLSASAGPSIADFARSLVLRPPGRDSAEARFMACVLQAGIAARDLDRARVDAWIRVIAAARISEGFTGADARALAGLARGDRRIDD